MSVSFSYLLECSDSDFQKATQRIYHESAYPSHLRVTVLQLNKSVDSEYKNAFICC